jgi:hypothetical protein
MKNFRLHRLFIVACVACVAAFLSVGAASAQPVNQASALAPIYICSDQQVPAGYVITGSTNLDYRCPNRNRWTLELASNNISACFGSSYPSPYFITAISPNEQGCVGFSGHMTLYKAQNGLRACVNGVLWSPWVITVNALTNTSCNGYGQIEIAQPSEGLRICRNSVIPSGWYVDGPYDFYICAPYQAETLHKLPSLAPQKVQSQSSIVYLQDGKTAISIPVSSE